MAFPSDGGGSAPRVLDQLNPLYTDIANLLGELAGNEAYLATLEANCPSHLSMDPAKIPLPPKGTWVEKGLFKVPGRYGFNLEHLYYGTGVTEDGVPKRSETASQLGHAAEQAWHHAKEGYSEAYGTVSSLRAIGRNVWEPDPSTMSFSVDGLVYLAGWLQTQLKAEAGWVGTGDAAAPAWLVNLQKGWPATSKSSESFYEFWDDVDDKCGHYRDIAARLAATCAQTTATVSDFQKNLLEVTTKTRDHVVLALKQWQTWQGPSGTWGTGKYDDNTGAKTILGGVSYGTGVIALIPPAAAVSGTISVVTGGLTYLIPDKSEIMQATSAANAGDIWTGYNSDVDSVCTRMRTALDTIHTHPPGTADPYTGSQAFDAFVESARTNRHNWEPLAVNI